MVVENSELNMLLFMEEVQKYPAIYNTFFQGYKNKFITMSIWKAIAIGEKFVFNAAEAEKYIRMSTARGRYLRKQKSVLSGSGRNAVPSPTE